MEKRKLIPLSMMLLCSLCFATACNTTSSTTNVIATVNNQKITAEDLYNGTLYNETTAAYVYEVLEKALIQSAVPETNSMRTKVENEVEKWQNELKANANLNGTNYKEDLQTALEEEKVNSVEELINKKIYALQVEYAKEKFLNATKETYTKAFIDENYLYHVGDIVLSISSTSTNTDLYNLTISSTEAKAIYNAFTELVEGEKYYNVASQYSKGDTASSGGDLGIVTLNDSDITNELRYALIGYSSIVEGKYNNFNLPADGVYTAALKEFYNAGAQTIPYSYIKDLNKLQDGSTETKHYESSTSFYYSNGGNSVSSSSKVYYRNIVFNNLLNTKTPKFITVTSEDVEAGANAIEMDVLTPNVDSAGYSTTKSKQYVLTNEYGNPYVVFKDSNGLHIMTINKTPFEDGLYSYYSSDINSDDNYVGYGEFGSDIEGRIAELDSIAEKYITKDYGGNTADERLLSFEMFKYYLAQSNNGNFKIVNENVKNMINQYMNSVVELSNLKMEAQYTGYYDTYSNLVWFRNQSVIVKEVPLLSCLTKASDGNYACVYKYGEGFLKHDPSTGGNN